MKDERIMKKIGLFYAANAVKTSQMAKKIREVIGYGVCGYYSGRTGLGQ